MTTDSSSLPSSDSPRTEFEQDLTKGPVGRHLIRLSVPMFFGIASMIFATLIDAWYVGQLGTRELAAVNLTMPLMMALAGLAMGLGVGATSVIARRLGAGDREKCLRIAADVLLLVLMLVIAVQILGFFLVPGYYVAVGTDPYLLPVVIRYTNIFLIGIPLLALPMVGGMMMRALGDVRTPAILMVSGAIVQVIIAPVLIFGVFEWGGLGLDGSAWAFTLSRLLVLIYALFAFRRFRFLQRPRIGPELLESWKEVTRLAVPSIASQLIMPLSMTVLYGLVTAMGLAAVAGFGIVLRIESLALVVLMAVSSSIGPFIGQNFGAAKFERVTLGYRRACQFSMLWGVIVAVALGLFGTFVISLFRDDPDVIDAAANFMLLVPITFGLVGIAMLSGSTFVAFGQALPSLILSLLRTIIVLIPLAFLLRAFWGIDGIYAAIAATNIIIGAVAFGWLLSTERRLASEHTDALLVPPS